MDKFFNDLETFQAQLATNSLLFGITIGSFATLLLLAIGHNTINRNKNNHE